MSEHSQAIFQGVVVDPSLAGVAGGWLAMRVRNHHATDAIPAHRVVCLWASAAAGEQGQIQVRMVDALNASLPTTADAFGKNMAYKVFGVAEATIAKQALGWALLGGPLMAHHVRVSATTKFAQLLHTNVPGALDHSATTWTARKAVGWNLEATTAGGGVTGSGLVFLTPWRF